MDGRWALVTGSSRGLGLEIALALARGGFRLAINGRDPDILARGVERLEAVAAVGHQAICLDLAAEGAPVALQQRLKLLGVSVTVLVNNLGGGVPGDRRNVPTDVLRAAMRLNLEVGVEVNNAFYDDLKVNRGVVVHIGSTASLHFDAPPGYVISKAALNAYVKNAARSFAKDGICIFAVLPGMLEHEGSYIGRLSRTDPDRYRDALADSTYGRFTTSLETARFIAVAVAVDSPMLNGSLIQFDGGKE